jgi:hypothetical protein
MNCGLADHLLDGYAEDELSQRDRYLVQRHLAHCARCAGELRRRPAFEREVRRALDTSAGTHHLSSGASARIINAAEESLQRAIWSHRAHLGFRLVGGVVAAALLLVGLFALMGRIPVPSSLGPVVLSPINRLVPSLPQADAPAIGAPSLPQPTTALDSSLPHASLLIEPHDLQPGEPFTISLSLLSDSPQPIKAVRLGLEVNGPTGQYRFDLVMKGSLPAHGMSVFRVTPALLAKPCQEQYLVSPAEIFRLPGIYTVRVIVSDAGVASR